jgi:CubicO group peptidase (beta-lactamase class C family)
MVRQPVLGVLTLALVLGGGLPCLADDPKGEQIDALVRDAGFTDDGPGVAVSVQKAGKVLFQKGYGLANVEKGVKITPDTTFELASVSKQFAGMAVLILVERGKVSFDDDVRKYIPELPEYDKNKDRPITLGDLSRHVSGLPDYMSFEEVKGKDPAYLTNADFLPEFAKQRKKFPLVFPTGAKYEYSNTGYMLLAAVVERVSGKSFGAFLKEEVFRPLGMKSAWVNESPKAQPHHPAVGYEKAKKGWKASWSAPTADHHETLLTTGDGAVWCNLHDMAAWDVGLREGKPVKTETLMKALAPAKSRDGKVIGYAAGWGVEYGDKDRVTLMSHGGSWAGFKTYIRRDLEGELTVIVLSNRGTADPSKLGDEVAALFAKPRKK